MEDFGKNVLEKLKEFQSRNVMEKKEMLKKINEAEEKYRILEETARKEEHLLTSALYNVCYHLPRMFSISTLIFCFFDILAVYYLYFIILCDLSHGC